MGAAIEAEFLLYEKGVVVAERGFEKRECEREDREKTRGLEEEVGADLEAKLMEQIEAAEPPNREKCDQLRGALQEGELDILLEIGASGVEFLTRE